MRRNGIQERLAEHRATSLRPGCKIDEDAYLSRVSIAIIYRYRYHLSVSSIRAISLSVSITYIYHIHIIIIYHQVITKPPRRGRVTGADTSYIRYPEKVRPDGSCCSRRG